MKTQISETLRKIILWGQPLVLLQIALGALYRHDAIGIIWHLAGAMSVAALLVITCVLLLRQIPIERAPRIAIGWLNALLVTQVTLGVTALMLKMLEMPAPLVPALHVTTGSLVFSATLVLWRATRKLP
jgi:heme A synthase